MGRKSSVCSGEASDELPDEIGERRITVDSLPEGWSDPSGTTACQVIRDEWLAGGAEAILRVPAATIPEEEQLLINSQQPDAPEAAVGQSRSFTFDKRIPKRPRTTGGTAKDDLVRKGIKARLRRSRECPASGGKSEPVPFFSPTLGLVQGGWCGLPARSVRPEVK